MAFVAPLILAAGAAGGTAIAGGTLATSLAVGSAALTGLSGFQQGMYQSAVAKNNAQIAADNAKKESDRAQVEQIRADRESAELIGTQEAIQGSSGLNLLGRSALLTRANARRVGRETALDIREQGVANTRNFIQKSAEFRGEAKQAKIGAFMSLAEGALEAGAAFAKPSLVGKARGTKRKF